LDTTNELGLISLGQVKLLAENHWFLG
jgi:hypothetical protein